MPTESQSDPAKSHFEQVLANYLQRRDLGETIDRDQWLRDHPDLADELISFFEDEQAVGNLWKPGDLANPDKSRLPEVGSEFRGTDRFRIQRRLGAGGLGVVYEAFDAKQQATVALKTLRFVDPAAIYRLKREFRALAGVVHPNLVALHELVSSEGAWFVTMELVDGVNFLQFVRPNARPQAGETFGHDHISTIDGVSPDEPVKNDMSVSRTNLDVARLRRSLAQLARGLSALHQAGHLHRDVKPSNVLVTKDGRVVLLDFGLVTNLNAIDQSTEHAIVGTVAYMAPEQALNDQLTEAGDWYSVGVMLFQALTGQLPYSGAPVQILVQKQNQDAPAPSRFAADVPDDLDALCVELLQRDPQARPAGSEVLRRLGEGTAASLHEYSVPQTKIGDFPLIGRNDQLATLNDAYRAVQQGGTRAVFVNGRSGIGKSALVESFLDSLRSRQEAVVLAGRCYERESVSFKAFDSLLDEATRYLRKLPAAEAAELMPREVASLARLFPALKRVDVVAHAPQRRSEASDDQDSRRRAFTALRELLARIGDRRPVVLHIDDLQWGDVDSAILLMELLRQPDPPRLLLLAGYRSEDAQSSACLQTLLESPQGTELRESMLRIEVESLSEIETRRLAHALLKSDTADARAYANTIARESQGIPFFVYEFVRYLRESERSGGHSVLARGITLEELVIQRVSQMPPRPRQLLEIVAVAGQPISLRDAYRAADLGTEDVASLNTLSNMHLVRTLGDSESTKAEPYHDRIRESIVARLSDTSRRDFHLRIARAMESSGSEEADVLAGHFDAGGEPGRAGVYAIQAAEEAAKALAFDRAANLYRWALTLPIAEDTDVNAIRTRLADALANAGRGPEAAREYLRLAPGATPTIALDLRRKAADHLLRSGHVDEALSLFGTVLGAIGIKMPSTPLRAAAMYVVLRTWFRLRGLKFRETDPAELSRSVLTRIDACYAGATGLGMIDNTRGAVFSTRHLLLALKYGEPFRITRGLTLEVAYTARNGIPGRRRTTRLLETADALAIRLDQPYTSGFAKMIHGVAALLEGRWSRALLDCDEAERLFRDQCSGVAWELGTTNSFGVMSLFFQGEVRELSRRLPRLLAEAQARGDLYAATNLSAFVGHIVTLAEDAPNRAYEDLGETASQWTRQGFHLQHVFLLLGEVQILLYQNDAEAAWQVVEDRRIPLRRSMFLVTQTIRVIFRHLRARSAIAAATSGLNARRMFRVARKEARRLEREKCSYAKPLARLIRASLVLSQNRSSEAMTLLESAAEAFDSAEMGLYAASARRRLGELAGGQRGDALIRQADEWMKAQGIVNPARMAAMHVPGSFGSS